MKRTFSAMWCALLCVVIFAGGLTSPDSTGTAAAQNKKQQKKAAKKKAKAKAPRRNSTRRRQRRPNRRNANRRRPGANRKTNKKRPANAQRRPNQTNNKRRKTKKEETEKTPAEKTPFVHVKSWKETREMIAKHKGKVVVVDLWASWCDPCVKEFPNLVALQKKYPKDVITYSFNVDNDGLKDTSLEKIRQKVKDFLTKHKAIDVQNVVSRESDEKAFGAAKIDSVPTILVFDRAGKLAKKIDPTATGGKDPSYEKHVVPLVEKLIKQK